MVLSEISAGHSTAHAPVKEQLPNPSAVRLGMGMALASGAVPILDEVGRRWADALSQGVRSMRPSLARKTEESRCSLGLVMCGSLAQKIIQWWCSFLN